MQRFNEISEIMDINELNDFMITTKNIAKIGIHDNSVSGNTHLNNYVINKNILPIDNVNTKKNISTITDIFFPKQRDMLFWCFYIIMNEMDEYENVKNYFTLEKDIKIKWVEEFRQRKDIFKTIKISRNSVEDELTNAKKISMASIKALCHLKSINIFYIDNKKYYEIMINDTNPCYVMEKVDGKYGLKQHITKDKLDYYRDNFWKLENLDKPLKAISSYKSCELKEICKRLHVSLSSNKPTKQEMYQAIIEKL